MPDIVAQFKIEEVLDLKQYLAGRFDVINTKFENLETKLMANFSQVMSAIESNGLAIADVASELASEKTDIQTLLQRVSNGENVSEADLNLALQKLQEQGSKLLAIKDAAMQLVPTVASPESPSQPGEVITTPIEPTQEVPASPDDIEISDSDVGLPGSVSVDLPPTESPDSATPSDSPVEEPAPTEPVSGVPSEPAENAAPVNVPLSEL